MNQANVIYHDTKILKWLNFIPSPKLKKLRKPPIVSKMTGEVHGKLPPHVPALLSRKSEPWSEWSWWWLSGIRTWWLWYLLLLQCTVIFRSCYSREARLGWKMVPESVSWEQKLVVINCYEEAMITTVVHSGVKKGEGFWELLELMMRIWNGESK